MSDTDTDDSEAMEKPSGIVLKLDTGRTVKLVLGEQDLQIHAIEPRP